MPLPTPRTGGAIAVDTAQNEALLFGGTSQADTWVFDGTSWQQRLPATSPPPRWYPGMAYDPVRDRTVLHGGIDAAGVLHDTWEWDGANWQPQPLDTRFAAASGRALGAFGNDLLVAVGPRLQRFHRTESQVAAIGTGCTNDAPLLGANGWPDLGAAGFVIETTYAPPLSAVLLAGAVTQVDVPVLGCTLHVDPTQLVQALPTDARGRANLSLPVPATTTLLGAELFFQGAALSPLAPAGLTLTRGLRIRVGR